MTTVIGLNSYKYLAKPILGNAFSLNSNDLGGEGHYKCPGKTSKSF